MTAPEPGRPPLLELVDLLSRRHALPALLFLTGGPQPFSTVVAHLGAAPPQVTQRLRELRESGLLEVDEAGDYRLTPLGRRLQGALDGLASVADAWARLTPRQRNPRGAGARGRGED